MGRGRGSHSNISSHIAKLQSRVWQAISSPGAMWHHPADKQRDYANTAAEESAQRVPFADLPLDVILTAEHSLTF